MIPQLVLTIAWVPFQMRSPSKRKGQATGWQVLNPGWLVIKNSVTKAGFFPSWLGLGGSNLL